VKRCAVTLAALGSQSRSSTAPSRPDAPTKLCLVALWFYPPGRLIKRMRRPVSRPGLV